MNDGNLYPPTPSTEELVEARERTDAGLRLAFPHLFDRSRSEASDMGQADGLGSEQPESERVMASLEQKIDEAGALLGVLLEKATFEERSLAAAVFNQFGVDFTELREQLPTLREAMRERGRVDA